MFKPLMLAISLSLTPAAAAAAWPEDHLDVADQWLDDVTPANNEYSSPSTVYYQNGVLHVSAVCGGFVAELLKGTYDALTDELMSALFDDDPDDALPWASPDSTHYYRAFLEERAVGVGAATYALVLRLSVDEIEDGDLLVSEYREGDITGHTMVIRRMNHAPQSVASTIPGFTKLDRYTVQIVDSSASVHMNKLGTTDTRYMRDVDPITGQAVNDRGLGRGDIHLYADPTTHALVGWSWAVNQIVAYQGVDPTPEPGVGRYRPILAGRIRGPGL